jgi:mRNA interferase HigB
MRIIALKTLRTFWQRYPDAGEALRTWYHDVRDADWQTPGDIKRTYASVSFVGNNRVIFNIRGNKYRLIVAINYRFRIVYIRFIGTHQQYDAIDAETI